MRNFGINLSMLRFICMLLIIVPTLVRATSDIGQVLDEAIFGHTRDAEATKYFQEYLTKCGTNEIRCVWFLDNKLTVGMVMTINLHDYSVFTVRDVYNWEFQNSETRKLSYSQVTNLQKIYNELPPSDSTADFQKSVSVSFWRKGKVKIFRYDRQHVPAEVQRIYDIGGGYFDDGREALHGDTNNNRTISFAEVREIRLEVEQPHYARQALIRVRDYVANAHGKKSVSCDIYYVNSGETKEHKLKSVTLKQVSPNSTDYAGMSPEDEEFTHGYLIKVVYKSVGLRLPISTWTTFIYH